MALRREHVEVLKDILTKIYHIPGKSFVPTLYPIDTIINGTDEEKMALIKVYLTENILPELTTSASSLDTAKREAEAKTTEYEAVLATLP